MIRLLFFTCRLAQSFTLSLYFKSYINPQFLAFSLRVLFENRLKSTTYRDEDASFKNSNKLPISV